MPKERGLYLNSVIAAGSVMFVDGLVPWKIGDPAEFLTYLILAATAATCRFRLPGLPANDALAFLIVLMGICNLSLPEALVLGTVAMLVEALWKVPVREPAGRVLLHVAACVISIVLAHDVSRLPWIGAWHSPGLTALVASLVFLLANGGMVAGGLAMVENRAFGEIARSRVVGAVPYYLAGAAVAVLTGHFRGAVDWRLMLSILAPVFVLYVYYRHFFEQRA